MSAYADFLTVDDPLLPRVREAALYSDSALKWLLDSVRHWARGEFLRRMERKEREPGLRWTADCFDEYDVQRQYHYRTVAVLVTHISGFDSAASPQFSDSIIVGMAEPAITATYVAVRTGRRERDAVRGTFDLLDIVRWPKEFELRKWPEADSVLDRRRPLRRDVSQSVCHGGGVVKLDCIVDEAERGLRNVARFEVNTVLMDRLVALTMKPTPVGGGLMVMKGPRQVDTYRGIPVVLDRTLPSDTFRIIYGRR